MLLLLYKRMRIPMMKRRRLVGLFQEVMVIDTRAVDRSYRVHKRADHGSITNLWSYNG